MFKLIDFSICLFAIVKAEENALTLPINVHGLIEVTMVNGKYEALLLDGKMSKELEESNEIELLKQEAVEAAEEFVGDK